jgi:hypothetical protein
VKADHGSGSAAPNRWRTGIKEDVMSVDMGA